jgi:hypothetical protein
MPLRNMMQNVLSSATREREQQQLLQQGPALPEALDEQAIGTMCAVAESILKNEKLAIDSSIVQLCKDIVLAGAKHPSPKFISRR